MIPGCIEVRGTWPKVPQMIFTFFPSPFSSIQYRLNSRSLKAAHSSWPCFPLTQLKKAALLRLWREGGL